MSFPVSYVAALLKAKDSNEPKWASDFNLSPIKRENVLYILGALKKILPHDRWFLGGSLANPEVYISDCGDIDIFFYSMDDYRTANASISTRGDCRLAHTSNCADSYVIKGIGLVVQLVKRGVGTPDEIMDTFDINVAKHIVCSDGQYIKGVDANDLIQVINPTSDTFSRVQKYMDYLRYTSFDRHDAWKNIIDRHIDNDSIVESYYSTPKGNASNQAFNSILYRHLIHNRNFKSYLNEKALEHAPELLV